MQHWQKCRAYIILLNTIGDKNDMEKEHKKVKGKEEKVPKPLGKIR